MGQDWQEPQVPEQWQQRPQQPQWPGQYGQEQQQPGYAPPWDQAPAPLPYQGRDPYWSDAPHQGQGPYRDQEFSQARAPYQGPPQQPSGYWPQQQYAEPSQQAYPQPPYSQQQPHRRAPRRSAAWAMWGIGAVVLLAGSAEATVVLRHHTAVAKPLTCKQQYAAWKTGPAHALGVKAQADAKALSAAGNSEDIKTMLSGLKALGSDATALQAYPLPACADPKGYWNQYLADLKASGDNADSASGLGGLLLAEAPLKNVKTLQSKMDAELGKTVDLKS
jgi:hypothetical protein